MDRIVFDKHEFSNYGVGDGKLLDGSFYVENSLVEDELSIDTLKFSVRYPLEGEADTSIINYPYGYQCTYYQGDSLFGKYYLVEADRVSKYGYTFSFQSAIGLLDDSTHYGGIYNGQYADVIIADVIGGKIPYTIKQVFSRIKLYGWLPIATRRENLKQILFAVGGCIKKNENGDVFITTLDTTSPKVIPPSRTMEGGKLTFNTTVSKVEITEHGYVKLDDVELEKVFEGELAGQSFITPKGFSVSNASLVKFEGPYHSLVFEGCSVLNDEIGVNYAVVTASPTAKITGKPYIHTEAIIQKEKTDYEGEEKVASVKEATLISLANSGSTAERVMAYYGNTNTLSTSFVLEGEKPTDTISITNPFEEISTGFIKNIEGSFGHSVSLGESEIILNYVPPTVVGSRTLVDIKVTTPPNQVNYATGDYFNREGMVVTAYYDDKTTAIINNYSISPDTPLTLEDTEITITYTEVGVTKTTTQPITVKTVLRRISVTSPPDNTVYYIGDTFDPTGMVVTAYYSDDSSKILQADQYDYSPKGALTEEDTTITITYEEDGISVQTYQDIAVGEPPNLVSIAITKNPDKMKYKLNESFNPTGMEVTAYYDDETSRVIKGYTYSPSGKLGKDDTVITVSYTFNQVTKTTQLNIEVIYLSSISVTNPPQYTEYYEGNSFNKYGMEVTATYSDQTTRILSETEYSVTPEVLLCTTDYVTITYIESGITVTTTQDVTVTYYPYDFTDSIVISQSGTYHLSDIGATHRNLRIIAISGGSGGQGGFDGENGTVMGGRYSLVHNYGEMGTKSVSNGQGGAGGEGGEGGSGGYISSFEVVLNTADDDIVITVGTGGTGGTNGAEGQAGTHSTCTINGQVMSSETGSISETGYTDIFKDITYAIPGQAGQAGGAGGDGINRSGQAKNGEDIGSYKGGAGSVSASNSGKWTYYEYTAQWSWTTYGSGGGGAAYGANGEKGSSGSGSGAGSGASAIAPENPVNFGSGGFGGHGGGGGGGAGGGKSTVSGDKQATQYFGVYRPDSGGGGKGSKGSDGKGGCIIIYFS